MITGGSTLNPPLPTLGLYKADRHWNAQYRRQLVPYCSGMALLLQNKMEEAAACFQLALQLGATSALKQLVYIHQVTKKVTNLEELKALAASFKPDRGLAKGKKSIPERKVTKPPSGLVGDSFDESKTVQQSLDKLEDLEKELKKTKEKLSEDKDNPELKKLCKQQHQACEEELDYLNTHRRRLGRLLQAIEKAEKFDFKAANNDEDCGNCPKEWEEMDRWATSRDLAPPITEERILHPDQDRNTKRYRLNKDEYGDVGDIAFLALLNQKAGRTFAAINLYNTVPDLMTKQAEELSKSPLEEKKIYGIATRKFCHGIDLME